MIETLEGNGNQLFISRAEMASESIETFILKTEGVSLTNAYVIEEALSHALLGEDYPIA